MAIDDTTGNNGQPISYLTAVWSGMTPTAIAKGVEAGTIQRLGAAYEALEGGAVAAVDGREGVESAPAVEGATSPATRPQVEGWFRSIDPSLSGEVFSSLWNRAGASDAARGATLRTFLAESLLGNGGASSAAIDAFVADPAHRASVIDLGGMTGSAIADLARSDIGYRHALATMQPIALTGNRGLFAHVNAEGALDRFDPDTGEQLVSDAWLGDRAKLLAWKSSGREDQVIAGREDWTFVDHTSTNANGGPATFELTTGAEDAGKNQVVFGNSSDEMLQGVSGSDRLYGGDGHDVLRGGGAGDHLEGGRGDDLLMGGAGHDYLAGDQGNDELEGGRGNDRLAGGSGDDTLTGGTGDDRLEGGGGRDTYVLESGDGIDAIADADGLGTIELDGAAVGGTMSASGEGQWASADGRFEFSFTGSAAEPGTLTIRASGGEGDAAPAPANVVEVKNWKNGDLGITLAGTPAAIASAGPNYDLASITGPEVPLLSDADLHADAPTGEAGNDASMAASGGSSDDIAWGDVAPVGNGGTSSSPATANDTVDSWSSDSVEADADFEDALAAIFDVDPVPIATVAPAHVDSAIQEFAGALAAPDITMALGTMATDGGVDSAVSAYDYADAIADYASDDADFGSALHTTMPMVPDFRTSEVARGIDSGLTRVGGNLQS